MAEIALGEEEVLILDRIEIEEKLVAYAVALDQRNWEALNEIFIEEANLGGEFMNQEDQDRIREISKKYNWNNNVRYN